MRVVRAGLLEVSVRRSAKGSRLEQMSIAKLEKQRSRSQ